MTATIALIFGIKIQPEWGYPLFSFSIPALFLYLNIEIKKNHLKTLICKVLLIHLCFLCIYLAIHYFDHQRHRTHYPGNTLASLATKYWQHYQGKQPIHFIGADQNSLGYYLPAYLKSKPEYISKFSFQQSPWINPQQVKQKGVLLIYPNCQPHLPKKLGSLGLHIMHPQCFKIPFGFQIPTSNNRHYTGNST